MTSCVDSRNSCTRPTCLHQVKCFEVSLTSPQWEHMFEILDPKVSVSCSSHTNQILALWWKSETFWGSWPLPSWHPSTRHYQIPPVVWYFFDLGKSSQLLFPSIPQGGPDLASDFLAMCIHRKIFLRESSVKIFFQCICIPKSLLHEGINLDIDAILEGALFPWLDVIGVGCNIQEFRGKWLMCNVLLQYFKYLCLWLGGWEWSSRLIPVPYHAQIVTIYSCDGVGSHPTLYRGMQDELCKYRTKYLSPIAPSWSCLLSNGALAKQSSRCAVYHNGSWAKIGRNFLHV